MAASMADETFAEMFAQNDKPRPKLPRPGERVSAKIVSVGKKHAVLDLAGGLDGMIDLVHFEGAELPIEGNRFEGVVLGAEGRTVTVGRSLARAAAAGAKGEGPSRAFEQARETRLPIDGVVKEVNKGGYVVEALGARCFCPMGQMSLRRIEDPTTMIGQKLQFIVTETKGRDAVLSRRALLEVDEQDRRAKTIAGLTVGARLRGTVVNIRDFGAFVDLGGIDGLIPVSELAWGRVKAQDTVKVGEEVEVELIKIEGTKPDGSPERVTLSLRALTDKPAAPPPDVSLPGMQPRVPRTVAKVGDVVEATVDKIESFGLFVSWASGRGLLPAAELSDNERGDLRKRYPVGSVVKAAIVDVRPDGKVRLSKKAAEANAERADAEAFLQTQRENSGFGTLAEKLQKAMKR